MLIFLSYTDHTKRKRKFKSQYSDGNYGTGFTSFCIPFKINMGKKFTFSGAKTINQKFSKWWEKLLFSMVAENRLVKTNVASNQST